MAATQKSAVPVYGTVKFFDYDRGFGFITPDGGMSGADVFVHAKALSRGIVLQPGDRVRFEVERTYRGTKAISVERDTALKQTGAADRGQYRQAAGAFEKILN